MASGWRSFSAAGFQTRPPAKKEAPAKTGAFFVCALFLRGFFGRCDLGCLGRDGCDGRLGRDGDLVLVFQFVVDGDDVLHREDRHHQKFKDEANADGGKHDHEQSAEEAGGDHGDEAHEDGKQGGEDVEGLQNGFDQEALEVENVRQDAQALRQSGVFLFGGDEDERENGCNDGKQNGKRAEARYGGDGIQSTARGSKNRTHKYFLRTDQVFFGHSLFISCSKL